MIHPDEWIYRKEEILDHAHDVLKVEAAALHRASELLDESFVGAIGMILNSRGKVIVSGLGKSGHVARKVAATLASTGTPSIFLHPAEALHGDLGVISEDDCLLVVAFGGETQETINVASFARRIGIPVIAITGRKLSSLAKLSDFVLDGSVEREACPLNLAPTSSTTVAMALGDAIAVALMRARGFKEEDFAQFHPGGSLGRRLSLVEDHMRKDLLTLSPTEGFHRILEVITSHNYGIAAVVEQNRLIGSITDGDLRRALIKSESEVFQLSASDLMTQRPKIIAPESLAVDAVRFMEKNQVSTLFVVETGTNQLKGLIRMYDLLDAKVV